MFQRTNRQPHQRSPIMRNLNLPRPRSPNSLQLIQYCSNNMKCTCEAGTDHVPDPLVSELIPVVWDQLDAVVDCFLSESEYFAPHLVVVLDECWHALEVHGYVEGWSVDPFQCHVVPATKEEFQVWIVFLGLDPCKGNMVPGLGKVFSGLSLYPGVGPYQDVTTCSAAPVLRRRSGISFVQPFSP